MKSYVENKFMLFCTRFRLSPTAKKNALRWIKNNHVVAEELMWLFQRRNDNSTVKLNCIFESPPSLEPLMTLMINHWKAAKICHSIRNGYYKKRTVMLNDITYPVKTRPSKAITFTMPNGVVCSAKKTLWVGHKPVYEFEFTIKGQKVILIREPQLIKQTVETLISHAVLITAKAWHWRSEDQIYPVESKEGKIFLTMIEQNIAREVATLLSEGPKTRV